MRPHLCHPADLGRRFRGVDEPVGSKGIRSHFLLRKKHPTHFRQRQKGLKRCESQFSRFLVAAQPYKKLLVLQKHKLQLG